MAVVSTLPSRDSAMGDGVPGCAAGWGASGAASPHCRRGRAPSVGAGGAGPSDTCQKDGSAASSERTWGSGSLS